MRIGTLLLGAAIVFTCFSGGLTVLNVQALVQTGKFNDHTSAIYNAAWSPDGTFVAAGSEDGTVTVYTALSGAKSVLAGHSYGVWNLSWSPDGKRIVSASIDGKVLVWDVGEGKQIGELGVGNRPAYSVSWSPDGTRIAVGYNTGDIAIYLADTCVKEKGWPAHNLGGGISTQIISIAWSPDGTKLASGGLDFALKVWNPQTGDLIREMRAETAARNDINGLAWAPDGTKIATAGQDGMMRIWDITSGKNLIVKKHGWGWIRGISWSSDGKYIATSGENRKIGVWDAGNGEKLVELTGHASPVWTVAWSPDATKLVSGSGKYEETGGDCPVIIWGVK